MSLLYLIPLLPFLGFAINGIGFKKIGKLPASIISTGAVLGSFILVISAFFQYNGQTVTQEIAQWISVAGLKIPFEIQVDALSLLMMLVITGVGTLIHLYSIGYMWHDEGFGKFFSFLNLFIFFMLVLVMGGNYVIMFIGWEGVGLASYLLIGFWNKNIAYGYASRKAFVMNRIGDLGFLIGIFLIIINCNSASFPTVFSSLAGAGGSLNTYIALCLFIGAMGKSAQIPLYTWLPDAMAGPTPVSALIHAATMVTAGIYIVIRSNSIYINAPEVLHFIAWIGLATAIIAACIGLLQNDIKKVLAYSTVSQLGYMFMALGVTAFSSAYFHVLTHAFFKALLFLGAGSVIHAMSNEQDLRSMGGLRKKLPITFFTFLIGTIAIAGIPPFAGFFSKDEILAHVFEHNKLMWGFALLGSFMTSFYMFRLLFLTFFGEFRGTAHQKEHLHESPWTMTLPLIILALFSMGAGFFNLPHALGGHAQLAAFMEPVVKTAEAADVSLEIKLMIVSVVTALVAFVAAYVIYLSNKKQALAEGSHTGLLKLVYEKFYIDELYQTIIQKPIAWLANFFDNTFEKMGILKLIDGSGKVLQLLSSEAKLLQSGSTGQYLFAMIISILVLLAFLLQSFLRFN
jgi:NADH-quinone oxidoreductase subunit L